MRRSDASLIGRLGLAVAAPRAALAAAQEPVQAGRAGTDLFVALVVTLVAVHTRELVAAGWLAGAVDLGLGLRAAVDVVVGAATTTLALLLVAAAAIWIGAGRARAAGRDFDLACVAVLPLLLVEVAASLVTRAAAVDLPSAGRWAVTGAGWAWAAALVALAVRAARRRADAPAVDVPDRRRAGLAVVAAVPLLLGFNVAWVVTHLDWLRPMRSGDPVPAFALPRIEEGGALGPPVTSADLAGHVVVLDFWATWCRPCLAALPALSALAAGGEVTVLSVNLDDPAAARALFDARGYRSTLVADDGVTADRFGVSAIPHVVVVDQGGVVRMVERGGRELGRAIELATDLSKR